MALRSKKIVIPRQNYQRQIRTYTVLTLAVLIAAGVYGFMQFQTLSAAQTALADSGARLTQMKSFETQIADQYTTLKSAFDEDFEEVQNAVAGVFPSEEDYTSLTEDLDQLVLTLNRQSPSIFMSNLKFSQPRISDKEGYSTLPFSMTLQTTRANLERFLAYAERSGSLDDATRLLDVRSIAINFPGQGGSAGTGLQANLLNVSLNVNAYFQLPAVEQK